jgi:dGTP triphosphohydrolase
MPPLPKPVGKVLGTDNRTIINTLVTDMIRTNLATPERAGFSDAVFEALTLLYEYNTRHIYYHPRLVEYAKRTENMLGTVFDFEQRELASRKQTLWGRAAERDPAPVRELHHFIAKMYPPGERPALSQVVIDHLSLMTDRYARALFEDVFLPKPVG